MMPGRREQRKHMYKIYRNRREMAEAGWQFAAQPELVQCRDCDSQIEWARSPRGKNVPVNANSCTVHFSTCGQNAPLNSSVRSPAPPPPAPAPTIVRPELVQAVRELALAINELRDTITQRAPATSWPQPTKSTGRADDEWEATDYAR
jgi:hypothetical protein